MQHSMTEYNGESVPEYPDWLETMVDYEGVRHLTTFSGTLYKLSAITWFPKSRVYLESIPLTEFHFNVNEGDRDARLYTWEPVVVTTNESPEAVISFIEDVKIRLESYIVSAVL